VGGDQIVLLERRNCKSTFGSVLGFKDPVVWKSKSSLSLSYQGLSIRQWMVIRLLFGW
jgi:hypothetical protein